MHSDKRTKSNSTYLKCKIYIQWLISSIYTKKTNSNVMGKFHLHKKYKYNENKTPRNKFIKQCIGIKWRKKLYKTLLGEIKKKRPE